MKKTISVTAPLVAAQGGRGGAVQPVVLTNLRPVCADDVQSALEVVPKPLERAKLAEMRPLCVINDTGGGEGVLCSRGRDLALIPRTPLASFVPVFQTDALPGEAQCGIKLSDGSALVMTSAGAVRVGAGAMSVDSCEAVFPPISICAEAANLTTEAVARRKLSRSYSAGERFTAEDTDKVIGDLVNAYTSMCAKAAAAGVLIQPTLVRYKLFDAAGNLIFTSAPTVVSHSKGAQCAGGTPLYSNDGASINAYTLQANTYRLRAYFRAPSTGYPRAAEVACCRIYMAPLFHPFIPSAPRTATAHNGGGSEAFVTAHLPGEYGGPGTGYTGKTAAMLKKALARMGQIERLAAVVTEPFRSTSYDVLLAPEPEPDAAAESMALQAALRKRVAVSKPNDVWLSAPHTASARCVATDASTVLWGGLKAHAYRGYSAANFAAAVSNEAWTARSTVVLADGSVCTFSENFSTGAPTSFSPMLCYPHPEARRIHITVMTATSTRYLTRELEPDESGRYAVSAEDSPLPIDARVNVSPSHPTGAAPVRDFPDYAAVADASTPLTLELNCQPGGEIRSVVTRNSTDQSWEFGRFRFLVGTSSGVHSIGVGAGRRTMSVRRLCEGEVAARTALCCGESGEAFALVDTGGAAGPVLMRLPASGRPTVLAPPAYYHAMFYDGLRRELWALTRMGYATVFCNARGGQSYRVTDVAADEVAAIGGQVYLTTEDALYMPVPPDVDTSEGAAAQQRSIYLKTMLRPYPRSPARVEGLTVGCTATALDVNVGLDVCNINGGNAHPDTSLHIQGALRSPATVALRTRPAQAWLLSVAGTVSADFIFDSLTADFDDAKDTR